MKKLILLITVIAFWGCDNSTAPTDCFGIANGTAAVDDCGVCAYIGDSSLGIYKIENNILTYAAYEPGTPGRPSSFNDSYARVFILTKQQ